MKQVVRKVKGETLLLPVPTTGQELLEAGVKVEEIFEWAGSVLLRNLTAKLRRTPRTDWRKIILDYEDQIFGVQRPC